MKEIKKILIIRFSSLGDIVLTTPVIKAAKLKFPQAEVFFLTKSKFVALLENNPYLSGIIELEDGSLAGFLSTLRQIRKSNFDVVIDLHSNLRSICLRNLSGSRRWIRYNKRWWARFLLVYFKKVEVSPLHTVESYLNCLKKLGIPTAEKMPQLYLDVEGREFSDHFLKEVLPEEILVGVVPGARWESKRWGEENFAGTIRIINGRIKVRFLLIGGKEDEELIGRLKCLIGHVSIVEAVGLSLPEISALISKCRIVLTNDSGPMHMAAALGVPVVAIFGPTHPKLGFSPLGEKNVILCADVECSPCSLHGKRKCFQKSKYCMERILPEMVADRVIRTIEV